MEERIVKNSDTLSDVTSTVTIMSEEEMESFKVLKEGDACDGTHCPEGCCLGQYNWYCCADRQHCAATADLCHPTKIDYLARLTRQLSRMRKAKR